MEIKILILALFVLNSVYGEEEPSLASYDKLNTFEMISQDQSFIIKTSEPSIAYFDSIDGNSIVYITTEKENFTAQTDERITGKFYHIDANVEYYVRNHLYYSYYTSTFKKYLYPINLSTTNLSITEEYINYLYLQKDNTYNLDFKGNTIKKMIKLSRKTPSSKVKIKSKESEKELNKNSLYYKLEDNFVGELELKVEEDDAFIEFLSNEGDYEILKDVEKKAYGIKKKTTLIKIDKTQKDFSIQLDSDKPFKYSFSYGFSNDEKYYYYSDSSPNIVPPKKEKYYIALLKILTPFKNIELIDNEFFSFTINVEFESNQNVALSYEQSSLLSPLMDEKLDKEYCEGVKKSLKEVFELYVFTDIAKNPPIIDGYPNYHHKPIDILKSLDEIKSDNRYFYEFYQEVMKIVTATKDLHLSISAFKTPKGIIFEQYAAALPFSYVIKKDNNSGKFKIYIQNNYLISYYEESVQKFILEHLDVPLKNINDQDPFDYIQNWSKYNAAKNEHAQFVNAMINEIYAFYLRYHPVNYSDINLNEFEFEDNKILRISYLLIPPNPQDVEFNEYFHNYMQKDIQTSKIIKIPFINEIREKYLIYKGLKKVVLKEEDKKEEEIEWNITLFDKEGSGGFIKCRVDEKNKVNVISQTTFSFDFYLGAAKIIECAKLFHTNAYPIIIIESVNGGGVAQLYMIMHQLFQMRTVERTYFSFRMSDISKKYYEGRSWEWTNIKTCKPANNYSAYEEVIDYYNYNNLNIEHKRNEAVDILSFYFRSLLRDYREKYLNDENLKKNLKRPTDIIIFTDSYSYSATSGFIKGFQNTGGAIIVGYFGNPKKEGIDSFDGSQSISSVESISNSFYLYKNLTDLGFSARVTLGESFDDSVYGKNPLPREYAFDPVDYRVDIYSTYSDDLYMKFIEEGKKIHKKFNEENYCNGKNDKLLLHSDKCKTIEGFEHAHGGYKCNKETNKWDTNNCQPYYCDIGYFFDQIQKNCVEECNFNDTKHYFIYEDVNQDYEIQRDLLTIFTFVSEKANNFYFYNFSEDVFPQLTKIGFIKTTTLRVNENKDAKENYVVNIKRIETDFQFNMLKLESLKEQRIRFLAQKFILILQFTEDHIFYCNDIFGDNLNNVKFASYNNEMMPEDIIEGNDKYFSVYTDKFIILEKEKINILIWNHTNIDQFHYYFEVKNNPSKIDVIGKETNFVYLEKDKEYTLDFQNNTLNRMIKLSKKTNDSEIKINNKNILLNSNNTYYKIEEGFKGKITLEATKSDAIIEFLFKMPDIEVLDYENLNKNSSKKYNLIKFSGKYLGKSVELKFKNNADMITFNAFFGYSKPPYSYYYPQNTNTFSEKNNTFNLVFNIPVEDKLMEDEYFCLMIENLLGDNLEIMGDYQNKDKSGNKKGFENWKIILIISASVVALLIIIIIIVCCCRKRKQLSNKEIEDKMENLNEIRDL